MKADLIIQGSCNRWYSIDPTDEFLETDQYEYAYEQLLAIILGWASPVEVD